MSDLIDRQAAITAICEDGTWLESQGCTEITMCERKQRDADILSELPTIEAEPVRRGKWEVLFYDNIPKIAKCSECGEALFFTKEDYPIRHISNYCPNCGAKMEEDDED